MEDFLNKQQTYEWQREADKRCGARNDEVVQGMVVTWIGIEGEENAIKHLTALSRDTEKVAAQRREDEPKNKSKNGERNIKAYVEMLTYTGSMNIDTGNGRMVENRRLADGEVGEDTTIGRELKEVIEHAVRWEKEALNMDGASNESIAIWVLGVCGGTVTYLYAMTEVGIRIFYYLNIEQTTTEVGRVAAGIARRVCNELNIKYFELPDLRYVAGARWFWKESKERAPVVARSLMLRFESLPCVDNVYANNEAKRIWQTEVHFSGRRKRRDTSGVPSKHV